MKIRSAFTARLAAVGLIALVMTACGGAASPASPALPDGLANRTDAYGEAGPAQAPLPAATGAPAAGNSATTAQGQPAQPRLIIRTADMTIIVTNTQEQLNAISKLATRYGGFVVASGTSQMGNDLQGQITLRVDAKNFDAALAEIRKLAVEVRNENVRGEDVTAEYVDLDAQLNNLEAAEAQLQKIMEGATKTEDVLNVYQRLIEIRGQIDGIKGRMKYLSQSAALSTINVSLVPDALAKPVEIGGWRLEGVVKSAVESLITLMQGLATLGINLVIVVLPVLVILALPIIALVWVVRRVGRRDKTAKAA